MNRRRRGANVAELVRAGLQPNASAVESRRRRERCRLADVTNVFRNPIPVHRIWRSPLRRLSSHRRAPFSLSLSLCLSFIVARDPSPGPEGELYRTFLHARGGRPLHRLSQRVKGCDEQRGPQCPPLLTTRFGYALLPSLFLR